MTFGEQFERRAADRYVVNPARIADWNDLVSTLRTAGELPDHIVHVTAVGPSRGRKRFGLGTDDVVAYEATVERDHASILFLAQALAGQSDPVRLALVTSGVHAVGGDDELRPERAMLHGAVRVIPRELGHVADCRHRHRLPPAGSAAEDVLLVDASCASSLAEPEDGRRRLPSRRALDPLASSPSSLPRPGTTPWTSGGVYVITGGLGGIGLAVAEHIAKSCHAPTLVLVGRTALPPRADVEAPSVHRAGVLTAPPHRGRPADQAARRRRRAGAAPTSPTSSR